MESTKIKISSFVELNQDFLCSAHNMIIQAYKADTSNKITHSSLSYVLSCILLSVCYLESFINSFYSEINDIEYNKTLGRKLEKYNILQALYKDFDIDRKSILEKYNIFLKYAKGIYLDRGSKIYQNTQILIDFRNELVHFKAYWSDKPNYKKNKNPVIMLKNKYRILVQEHESSELLGFWRYPCACWALNTVINFTEFFWNQLFPGEKYIYAHHTDKIKISLAEMKWESKYNNTSFKK